jgi:ADP-ribosylglycohydrolase
LSSGQGQTDERSNGNGSLMRIAPLAFFLEGLTVDERWVRCFAESAVTHAHPRSQLACWLFVEVLLAVKGGLPLSVAVDASWDSLEARCAGLSLAKEWTHFSRCRSRVANLSRTEISSSGYVVHTLEATLWCVLTTTSYRDAVLAAVNLGSDTDTTGAVTGALAGLVYGREGIPMEWLEKLQGREQIDQILHAGIAP